MGWAGLALLAVAIGLMVTSGWPTYVVLLAVSVLGAGMGIASGAFEAALVTSLPQRVVGLLESDLLQALALYALVGALLNRLQLADDLYRAMESWLLRHAPRAAAEWAGLALATLLAPMNGSVGASLLMTARTSGQRWAEAGLSPARRAALTAVAGTKGVIVPPSLVLLLLGDAMLTAHTEGLHLAQAAGLANASVRIINTQDVMQAVLLPGALLLLLWLGVSWLTARPSATACEPDAAAAQASQPRPAASPSVVVVPLTIATMMVLITLGIVRAVEGAATFGLSMLLWGTLSGRLNLAALRAVLDDALAATGTLFALLIAATGFSLVLRGFGTDRLVAGWMRLLQGEPWLALGLVLGLLVVFAFVLDAFELIFLIVPILMPPLLAQVADAPWVSALTLLVLQAGFLLPPLGFAVALARSQQSPLPPWPDVARALVPYLGAVGLTIGITLAWPALTHPIRTSAASAEVPSDAADVESRMRAMSEPTSPVDPVAPANSGATPPEAAASR